MATQKRKDPLVWGIILIVISLIILLENHGVEFWDTIARLWPVILIAWGAWKFYFGIKDHLEESEKNGG